VVEEGAFADLLLVDGDLVEDPRPHRAADAARPRRRGDRVRRREFTTLLGGAAATWPLAANAQQPAMPMIGFFHSASPGGYAFYVTTFRNGLKEAGYIEGRNVAVECPRAEGQLKEGGSPCNIETAHLRWW
jgi:hypothetical protein